MSFYETNYPGTVMCVANWVCHLATDRCARDDPHFIDECGDFDPPRYQPDPLPLGPWPRRTWMNYETMTPIYWTEHGPRHRCRRACSAAGASSP